MDETKVLIYFENHNALIKVELEEQCTIKQKRLNSLVFRIL